MSDLSAQQILEEGLNGDDIDLSAHVPVAALIIVETISPEGEPNLVWRRDTDVGLWRHIGMVESVLADLKHDWVEKASE